MSLPEGQPLLAVLIPSLQKKRGRLVSTILHSSLSRFENAGCRRMEREARLAFGSVQGVMSWVVRLHSGKASTFCKGMQLDLSSVADPLPVSEIP